MAITPDPAAFLDQTAIHEAIEARSVLILPLPSGNDDGYGGKEGFEVCGVLKNLCSVLELSLACVTATLKNSLSVVLL